MTRKEGASFFCGASVQVSANYEVTTPAPLYAGQGSTLSKAALCKENKSPCPAASQYLEGTALKAALPPWSELVLSAYGGSPYWQCTASTIEATVLREATEGAPANFNSFKLSGCTSAYGSCTETAAQALPWHTEFVPTSSGNGEVDIHNMALRLNCGGVICKYGLGQLTLTYEGVGAKAVANKVLAKQDGGALCPNAVTMNATYAFSTPSPLYVEPV